MEFKKTLNEFMLLPIFVIGNWYTPEMHMIQRVYIIGWLKWFIIWKSNKVRFDFETRGYESYF